MKENSKDKATTHDAVPPQDLHKGCFLPLLTSYPKQARHTEGLGDILRSLNHRNLAGGVASLDKAFKARS